MSQVNVGGGARPYVGFYKGKRVEVYAINALQAQQEAAKILKLTDKQRKEVSVILADVTHNAAEV